MNRGIVLLVLGLAAGPLMAAESSEQASPHTGETTRAWLELQRSNNASWGTPRPMPGEVAQRVYERYLESFESPIPAEFERESFVGGSSGN